MRPMVRSRFLTHDYGFEFRLYPVPAPQMQNQSSLWLEVRRDRLDWIYLQGCGAMNPTAVQEAIKIGFPMDRLLGVWWSGSDDDARPAGSEAKGYSALISSDPGHPQIRRRQGSEPGHIEGQSRREPLQPRRSQALKITDARWKEIGLPGFTAPVHLSCADHNGHGGISLVQWDGTKWSTTVSSIQPIKDKVLPLIDSTAEEYVKANAG